MGVAAVMRKGVGVRMEMAAVMMEMAAVRGGGWQLRALLALHTCAHLEIFTSIMGAPMAEAECKQKRGVVQRKWEVVVQQLAGRYPDCRP
eukprot:243925-Pelagomonas_calceolata.AAC.1